MIGKTGPRDIRAEPKRTPEASYAYYRRCQQFRRNGEQCKAPAMKGEAICYRHAEQADAEQRRAQQRREFLARPGVGFGSFKAIQRTISELARAILAGAIDRKVASRLMVDIQTAIRLQRTFTTEARRPGELPRKSSERSRCVHAVMGHSEATRIFTTEARRRGELPEKSIDIRLKSRQFSCRHRQHLNHGEHKGALRNEEGLSIVVRANRYLGHARLFKGRGGIG